MLRVLNALRPEPPITDIGKVFFFTPSHSCTLQFGYNLLCSTDIVKQKQSFATLLEVMYIMMLLYKYAHRKKMHEIKRVIEHRITILMFNHIVILQRILKSFIKSKFDSTRFFPVIRARLAMQIENLTPSREFKAI